MSAVPPPTQGNGQSASYTIGYFVGVNNCIPSQNLRYEELERQAVLAHLRASKTINLDPQDFKKGYFAGYQTRKTGRVQS